jgi:hypothetical protein
MSAASGYVSDPARDARAELRARELLRLTAGDEVAEMYDQLGFVGIEAGGGEYGYIVYPHRPLVAYDARSGEPLSEYCVRFRDGTGADPAAGEWLPDADDVLAKWLGLHADERGLVAEANIDPLGRQLDPGMVRRDLAALCAWRSRRATGAG